MSGIDLLIDTNILINLFEGKKGLNTYLQGNRLFLSVISEIELLGWYKISDKEKKFFLSFLNDCRIIELSPAIKLLAIELRQRNKVKIPDAIIAATSLYLKTPLLTFDFGFQKIENLNLLLLDN